MAARRFRQRAALQRQRGVAVITALLLTTLAVTIVASLFWQQQVQVRTIENQRMQLQKQWILRGALDWARLILNTSYRSSPMRDTLQDAWAVGLAETRLDSYVENGRSDSEASDASIAGKIIDAQSYLNLAGLSQDGVPVATEVAAFGRLLTLLRLDPGLADAAAGAMAAAQPKAPVGAAAVLQGIVRANAAPPAADATAAAPAPAAAVAPVAVGSIGINQMEDLLAVPGFTPEMITKLKQFAVILPRKTPVNVNTASAEVLSARIASLSLAAAQAIVARRETAYFRDLADFGNQFAGQAVTYDQSTVAVRTDYFIVDGKVRLSRAGLEVLALIKRSASGSSSGAVGSEVIWIREK
jgi:general secretion pathway protein K